MKIRKLETVLANAGLRNYLFVLLRTDEGITGLGEASLEWQEKTVQTLLHEWAEDRVTGQDPFDIERVIGGMIRDQYQGGSTVMTAISAIEIACWDIIGKACNQPIYRLLGGKCRDRLPSYANGWYGGARKPAEFAAKAEDVVKRGYQALKLDPFGIAWKEMDETEMARAERIVAAVREAVGDEVDVLIEVHGRLSVGCAVEMGRRLAKYRPGWFEEPVTPNSLDLLLDVKSRLSIPIAAGERLYTLEELSRLASLRAADVIQPDISHCGGLHVAKKVAAVAQAQDLLISPHCSIGPVALCAALHFDFSTANVKIQENFSEFDVPWRADLVHGWNPVSRGEFLLDAGAEGKEGTPCLGGPGLGIELDLEICRKHPHQAHSFPSLWDGQWMAKFTQTGREPES